MMGFVNGIVHVGLRIPSFMATLGMWFVGVGIANAILGGVTVRVMDQGIRALALERLARRAARGLAGAGRARASPM